jgi:uncharacterized membrane protein YkvA (DUF1232 family)
MDDDDTKDFKGFYDTLLENLEGYEGEYKEILQVGPKLFKILTRLLTDHRVKKEDRLMIDAAIAYFVAPKDVIPEATKGPEGYLDDIYLCSYVLNELKEDLGLEVIEDNWKGEEDIEKLLDETYAISQEAIGVEKALEVLEYSGLK